MDNDDRQVGRVLSRREALKLLAAASAATLASCGPAGSGTTEATSAPTGATTEAAEVVATLEAAGPNTEAATAIATAEGAAITPEAATGATAAPVAAGGAPLPTCIVTPELTEGPYFLDEQLNRSDIRAEPSDGSVKPGVSLHLAIRVAQIGNSGCTPLEGATVDIWHCDALGVYSGVGSGGQGLGTEGQTFLRGYQITDANGTAQFSTIYPGWYPGRTVHIHFKVRADAAAGQGYEFTSQLFFDEATWQKVYTQEPYASKGMPDTTNESDGIFRGSNGQLLIALAEAGQGYTGTFDVGLNL